MLEIPAIMWLIDKTLDYDNTCHNTFNVLIINVNFFCQITNNNNTMSFILGWNQYFDILNKK